MKAIEILTKEHESILKFLDYLVVANDQLVQGTGPSKEFFEKAINIARSFADKFHHYKEEYVMFGLLAQKHNGQIDGEIERHRSQHEHCRNLINEISKKLDGYSKSLDSSSRTLHRNLTEYIHTLRSHIRSENEVFFPMVENALNETEQESLLQDFAKYETKSEQNLEMNTKLVEDLGHML